MKKIIFLVSSSLTYVAPIFLVVSCRGYQELLAISAAIQMVLSTPVSTASALKGIQKTLGKALPFKVSQDPLPLPFFLNLVYRKRLDNWTICTN